MIHLFLILTVTDIHLLQTMKSSKYSPFEYLAREVKAKAQYSKSLRLRLPLGLLGSYLFI